MDYNEYLRNKGITCEKVITDLTAYRDAHPVTQKKRLPTEMYDKVNLMCRNYMDRLARFEMDYDFIADSDIFKTVAICCLETVTILRSQVINHPIAPYWKVADYEISDFVDIREVDDIQKAREEFFSREIPLKSNVQMNLGVYYYEGRTYVLFIWNHMCFDGGGFKMFWSDFCKNYTEYALHGVPPVNFSVGSREYAEVYRDFDKKTAKKAKMQLANVSPRTKVTFPFTPKNGREKVVIVSRRIPEEYFSRACLYAKSVGATVTDLLLACYIDALGKIAKLKASDSLSVACAMDLRRHIKDLSRIGYTNHVSFMHCAIERKGSDLRETLLLVRDKTKELKNDEFMGLHGLPLLNFAYKNMFYFQAESVVKLFYNNPQMSVSNVGKIEPDLFPLGASGPFDAFVAGAAKNKPCAVMTALTIGGALSASICLRGNEEDRQILESFFTEFENNLKSF
ncbi:MAG: hypothetical protein J6A97_10475 [Clostridia bacterium]|nr:hypothetical protein [Clostridia bacterium]